MYAIFPSIEEIIEYKYLEWTHTSVQYVNGDGYLTDYLYKYGHRNITVCECGVERQTPDHVTLECVRYMEDRAEMLEAANWANMEGPLTLRKVVLNPRTFAGIVMLVNDVARKRKLEELEVGYSVVGKLSRGLV